MAIFWFLIVISVLVIFHELGHFVAAKLFRIKVTVFSLFMGPRLFGIKIGETDYRMSLLPLGGYVKIAGQEKGDDPAESNEDPARLFYTKPRWQRFVVIAAGPFMSLLLAVLLFAAARIVGIEEPAYLHEPVVIGYVAEKGAGAELDLKKGDQILAVNGKEIKTWMDIAVELSIHEGPYEIKIGRERKNFTVILQKDQASALGIFPKETVLIGNIRENSPAEGKLQIGDQIVALDSKPIFSFPDFIDLVQKSGDEPFKLTLKRGERDTTVFITPKLNKESNRWTIGIERREKTVLNQSPPLEAIKDGFDMTLDGATTTVRAVKNMVSGSGSTKSLSGPIDIAKMSDKAAKKGFATLLLLMAIISMSLGILNVLPVPPLDGGHMFILLIESAVRRDLPLKAKTVFYQLGLLLMLALFFFVIYNDLSK